MNLYNEVTGEVNLDFFCHDNTRPELAKPFSIHAHSYASNEHLLVRISRRPDIAEHADEKFRQGVLRVISDAGEPVNFHTVSLPPETEVACTQCGGNGKEHDCPRCECACSFCDGDGVQSSDFGLSVAIGNSPCQAGHIRHLLSLPGFRIAPRSKEQNDAPLRFSFDAGDGLLMPLGCECGKHIIAELAQLS
jgi:hypothetical protein